MAKRCYYAVLGVAPTSEDFVIQAAYRAMMRRYHPDTNKDSDASKRALEINEAYAVLSNPAKRAAYDAQRSASNNKQRNEKPKQGGAESGSRPPPPPPPPRDKAQPEPPAHANKTSASSRWAPWLATLAIIVVVRMIIVAGRDAIDRTPPYDYDSSEMMNQSAAENAVMASANEFSEPLPTTLADQPQSGVRFTNIESASLQFTRVFFKNGILGARAFSEKCESELQLEVTWDKVDYCAAFDLAAAHIDELVSREGNWPKNSYFAFRSQNVADLYKENGAMAYAITQRLRQVKESAENTAREAVQMQLAREEAKRESEEEKERARIRAEVEARRNSANASVPSQVDPDTSED